MEQAQREEFFDRDAGLALQRLGQLQPGQSIFFVGLRDLAEVLVENALVQGLKIQADFKEGFNRHVLTLVEKGDLSPVRAPEESPEIPSTVRWVRMALASLFSLFRG